MWGTQQQVRESPSHWLHNSPFFLQEHPSRRYVLYYAVSALIQSKRKIFLSTCPSDKHNIKFCCPKPKSSCPKSNSKLKKNWAFNVFNHIISLVNFSWLKPKYNISNVLTGLITKARFLSQTEHVKTSEMAAESPSLREFLYLFSSSMRFAFMINKINFNSTVIWSRFSTVPVFFCIKNVLVPRTSHVKGLHVRTKFLPVPDNRT